MILFVYELPRTGSGGEALSLSFLMMPAQFYWEVQCSSTNCMRTHVAGSTKNRTSPRTRRRVPESLKCRLRGTSISNLLSGEGFIAGIALLILHYIRTQRAEIPNVPALLEGSSELGYPCAVGSIHAEVRISLMTSRASILTESNKSCRTSAAPESRRRRCHLQHQQTG